MPIGGTKPWDPHLYGCGLGGPYAEAVAWAEQNGYLGGYGNGFFGPEDMMSVEQAMVMSIDCSEAPR